MLDKAQELNTSAREVFEYTARCKKSGANSGVSSFGGGAKNGSARGIKRGDAGKTMDRSGAARPEGQSGITLRKKGVAPTKVKRFMRLRIHTGELSLLCPVAIPTLSIYRKKKKRQRSSFF